MPRPKKVGTLKRAGSDEEKRTNEIGMAIPLLSTCDISGRDITADALLTQRSLAEYIVSRGGHYHFTVKKNQPTLFQDIQKYFEQRGAPDYAEPTSLGHGRIVRRRIWCSTALNAYLAFPHVGQAFMVERECTKKKTGKKSCEIAIGITSRPPEQCTPQRLLEINRGHWTIESVHHMLDWNYDEDRSRIRTGHGPANVTRMRRFAIGLLKSFRQPKQNIPEMMQQLLCKTRMVFDYMKMTVNSAGRACHAP